MVTPTNPGAHMVSLTSTSTCDPYQAINESRLADLRCSCTKVTPSYSITDKIIVFVTMLR